MLLWRFPQRVDSHGHVLHSDVRCCVERRNGYRLILRRGLDVILSEVYESIHPALAHAEWLRKELAAATADVTSSASANATP